MKEAQLIKIQDNYDLRDKNNKVQESYSIRRRRMEENSIF